MKANGVDFKNSYPCHRFPNVHAIRLMPGAILTPVDFAALAGVSPRRGTDDKR